MAPKHVSVQLNIEVDSYIDKMWDAAIGVSTLCPVCRYYLRRRGSTLVVAVVVAAARRNLHPKQLLVRYLRSVHARHAAGESLSTRPVTPTRKTGPTSKVIHVKRSCNGCQKSLGDARPDELEAAATGARLLDVTLECGCWTPVTGS